jgi:Protein of unknown function (DUF3168)
VNQLETLFIAALANDPTYSGLVTGKTWLVQLPQNPTYPAAAIQRVSTVPLYVQTGPGDPQQAAVGRARLQFTCWVRNDANAGQISDAIAQAVLNVARSFSAYGSPPTGSPTFMLNRRMELEPQTQPPLFKQVLDLLFWYSDF